MLTQMLTQPAHQQKNTFRQFCTQFMQKAPEKNDYSIHYV